MWFPTSSTPGTRFTAVRDLRLEVSGVRITRDGDRTAIHAEPQEIEHTVARQPQQGTWHQRLYERRLGTGLRAKSAQMVCTSVCREPPANARPSSARLAAILSRDPHASAATIGMYPRSVA